MLGEWPAIILNFINKEQSEYIPLRPITLAFEDKCRIVVFFVETFQRPPVASEVATPTQL